MANSGKQVADRLKCSYDTMSYHCESDALNEPERRSRDVASKLGVLVSEPVSCG